MLSRGTLRGENRVWDINTLTWVAMTQPGGGEVGGVVEVSNFPATQAVTGTFWQATQPVSLAAVPSHAVTNAGTFAVQAAQSGTWTVTGAGGTFPVTGTFWQATQPVSGTFWQATQPVSATNLDIRDLTFAADKVDVSGSAVDASGSVVNINAILNGVTCTTGTITSVNDSASSVTILSPNSGRKGATVYNSSSAALYLKLGSGAASASSFTVRLVQNAYYEVPFGYLEVISGIWASDPGDGAAIITEFTA